MSNLKTIIDVCYIVLLIVIAVGIAFKIYHEHWERGITNPVIKQMAYDLVRSRQENKELKEKIAELEAKEQ